jgi:precorrin-4/cobalt-precorrin-4 C11-methyltransferase
MISFVGAGPGAPDLLTLRGADRLARADVVIWASSLVPEAVLSHCRPEAEVHDSKTMTLEDVVAVYEAHPSAAIVRLHSGDPTVYSAVAEQVDWCVAHERAFEIVPGVGSLSAAAAAAGRELTVPGLAQSVVLTRTSGRASAMPPGETLEAFAATGATLAIHLSIHAIERVAAELLPHYGAQCPAAIVFRASWPDQRILRGTLSTIARMAAEEPIERTALILVGQVLDPGDFRPSALYDRHYRRRFRGEPQ